MNHVIFWVLLIAGEVTSVSLISEHFSLTMDYFYFYCLNISLFYAFIFCLFRYCLHKKFVIVRIFLVLFSLIAIYLVLAIGITFLVKPELLKRETPMYLGERFYVMTIWRGMYFMLFAGAYFLLKSYFGQKKHELENEIRVGELKHQLITTEQSFLRSQINPHLLFNTFNFIKHATRHHPENARLALTYLSDIIDYALGGDRQELVELSDEIIQINNMVNLIRLRYADKLNIKLLIETTEDDIKIIPIVLLTLVENIFKHGNPTDIDHPVVISIKANGTVIQFSSTNSKSGSSADKGTKTGLENVRARLVNAYGNKHHFKYGLQDNVFVTELKIYLK